MNIGFEVVTGSPVKIQGKTMSAFSSESTSGQCVIEMGYGLTNLCPGLTDVRPYPVQAQSMEAGITAARLTA